MSEITVIGTGTIGSAIAGLAVKGGSSVQLLGRDEEKAAVVAEQSGAQAGAVGDALIGDIVVLAVPHAALEELVELYGDQLDGKILVDVTNPLDFATFDRLTVPADGSSASELQKRVPAAKVLKAFNTNFGTTLLSGQIGALPTTVLIAGDDDSARQALIDMVTAGGLAAISVGGLKRARELESLAFLQLTLAATGTIGWAGGFALQH